jgi:hypothetical protein
MEEFQTARELVREGKLDRKLRIRLLVYIFLSVLFGGGVLYDILSYGLSWSLALGFASASFLFGLVFSKMNRVAWDEKREVVTLGRIDIVGIVFFLSYVVLRFLMQQFLEQHFKLITVSGLTYATVFGLMLGLLLGSFVTIHKANTQRKNIVEK